MISLFRSQSPLDAHRHVSFRATTSLLLLLTLLFSSEPHAQSQQTTTAGQSVRELLNSERIEQTFGSYGIEVLTRDRTIRVSKLYSFEGAQNVCRTFAVVRYPEAIDPSFASEHELILSGGSIGATFVQHGWEVNKAHRYFGTIQASSKLAELMGGIEQTDLALHLYVLTVAKGDSAFEYAAIVEVHHPEYLSLDDLHEIYGGEQQIPATPDEFTRQMLEVTAERID